MVRTLVGYTGGTKKNPTYHELGDHTESIEVVFDPSIISYEDLLKRFWKSHNPCSKSWSRQYMSAVFYHNESQKKLAEKTRDSLDEHGIVTPILPAGTFHAAEDYHQKFYLKRMGELTKEYTSIYPKHDDFVSSTAVARVNGYIGGYGNADQLTKEINDLGLSDKARDRLKRQVSSRSR